MKITYILALAVSMAPLLHATSIEDPSRKTARELVRLMNSRDLMILAIESSAAKVVDSVPENKRPAALKAFSQFAAAVADSPELSNGLVDIYMEAFSEPELVELVSFYSTPLGKKTLEKMPELFLKGAKIGEEVANANQPALESNLQRIMTSE